ncbi:MAG: hypothetical protein R2765_12490 [Ferruginibacter sp.]|nr:hypothetical protein [Bacteroidota bacterium]MBX2920382.1 hypothetical protein [Ferruginibacter sp.]MCB0708334.1 hypothetical protein [Chitinophagaceae bacterium]
MTDNKFIISTFFAFIIVCFLSCDKTPDDNKCLSYTQAPVTKVEGPNTGNVNQDINLIVSFGCFNGCGQFGKFEQTSDGDTTTINVIAKYEGCICTQDAPIRQTTYKFKATQPGIYFLKFLQTEKAYLTDTIQIQ